MGSQFFKPASKPCSTTCGTALYQSPRTRTGCLPSRIPKPLKGSPLCEIPDDDPNQYWPAERTVEFKRARRRRRKLQFFSDESKLPDAGVALELLGDTSFQLPNRRVATLQNASREKALPQRGTPGTISRRARGTLHYTPDEDSTAALAAARRVFLPNLFFDDPDYTCPDSVRFRLMKDFSALIGAELQEMPDDFLALYAMKFDDWNDY